MNEETGSFTIFFEDPYWVGLFISHFEEKTRMARFIFGPEPGFPEVRELLLNNFSYLNFIPVSDESPSNLIIHKNPKKALKKAAQKQKKANQVCKSMDMYKEQMGFIRKETKKVRNKDQEILVKEKFIKEQDKKKKKKKGH